MHGLDLPDASRPVAGEALPLAWRVIGDLYNDRDSLLLQRDEARESLSKVIEGRDRIIASNQKTMDGLERTIDRLCDERDALKRQADAANKVCDGRTATLDAVMTERDNLRGTVMELQDIADHRKSLLDDLNKVTPPFVEAAQRITRALKLLLDGMQGALDLIDGDPFVSKEAVRESLGRTLAHVADIADEAPAEKHPDLNDQRKATLDAIAADLPPGFIEIDPATLPSAVVEQIRARTGPDAKFYEVDASEVPTDLFRTIYGIAPKPTPERFGDGCTHECNEKGCARERAEAADS